MMYYIGALSVPLIMVLIITSGILKRVKIFDAFTEGAKEGIASVIKIFPSLLGLMVAISMLKASGILETLTEFFQPLLKAIKMPPEVFPLALMRPVSGSGSLSILTNILKDYGPDSLIGKCASVIMGSTETTFYTIAVYYGAVGIKKTRHTVPCALTADIVGMISAVIITELLL